MWKQILNVSVGVILGVLALLEIPAANDKKTFNQLLEEANAGKKKSMYFVALCYWRGGDGTVKDEALATYWLLMSAYKNFAPAQHALGILFANKKDTERSDAAINTQQAISWYQEAVKNGHEEARAALEVMRRVEKAGGVDKLHEFTADDFKNPKDE